MAEFHQVIAMLYVSFFGVMTAAICCHYLELAHLLAHLQRKERTVDSKKIERITTLPLCPQEDQLYFCEASGMMWIFKGDKGWWCLGPPADSPYLGAASFSGPLVKS